MGARRIRREQRATDQAFSRRTNGMRKMAERIRRDVRMRELVKKGSFPYTPSVLSWLSAELDKPSSKLVPADVAGALTRVDARMADLVKKGTFPYTPAILSWLSAKLDKPSSKIVPADVDALLKAQVTPAGS
jgi:hypothetical protein